MNVAGFASVNGAHLYYEVAGAGHPRLLVHGFSFDTRLWEDQLPAFAQRDWVVRYAIRRHGRSAPPGSSSFDHAEDLRALLDHLGIEQTHLLGLSLGAAIATEFVVAYPLRATALVAVDPVLWGHAWSPEYVASLRALAEARQVGGAAAPREAWLAHPLFAPTLERPNVAPRLGTIAGAYSGWHWEHEDPARCPIHLPRSVYWLASHPPLLGCDTSPEQDY